jgi:hypothetical protein
MTDHRATPHLSDDELVLVHFDECPDRPAAEAHLTSCASCRDELEQVGAALALVAEYGGGEAPDGFERVMWARVDRAIQATGERPRAGWREWFAPRRLMLAGGAAAAIVLAFAGGRWSTPAVTTPPPAAVLVGDASERVLLDAAGDHLDRSQRVLVEWLNGDPQAAMPASQRDRAADLVAVSRLIRQSATDAGETALVDVLDDLERVLMELANGSDAASAEELRRLRERIEARGILFRLRVVGLDVREREKPRGPTS